MPSVETIYLHIGLEKTATTTLQAVLAGNRSLLRQHGFTYPTSPGDPNHVGLAVYAAEGAAVLNLRKVAGCYEEKRYLAFKREFPGKLAAELEAAECASAILSNEHCSSRLVSTEAIRRLHDLLAPLAREVRVLVYLRRQDELAESLYSTAVKVGTTKEFVFPHGPRLRKQYDYLHILDQWAAVFGRDHVIVRIYQKNQLKDGDIIADFFSAIGFEHHALLEKAGDSNPSLDVYALEFLRRLNAHIPLFTDKGVNPDRGGIVAILERISGVTRLKSDPAAAAAFLEQFADSNAAVARNYLGRSDGVLFATSKSRTADASAPALDVEKCIEIAAVLWREQQAVIRKLERRRPR